MNKLVRCIGVITIFFCVLTFQALGSSIPDKRFSSKKSDIIPGEVGTNSQEELRQKILEMLPQPLDGYGWVLFRGVALQRPLEWYEYMEGGAYCSSVETVPDNGIYETGVTVEVIRDISRIYNMTPKILMAHYVVDLDQKEENSKIIIRPRSHGDIETLVYRYRNAPEGMIPITVHKYFQVSEKDDCMNIITFETTEEKWEEYWNNQGKIILGKIVRIPYF